MEGEREGRQKEGTSHSKNMFRWLLPALLLKLQYALTKHSSTTLAPRTTLELWKYLRKWNTLILLPLVQWLSLYHSIMQSKLKCMQWNGHNLTSSHSEKSPSWMHMTLIVTWYCWNQINVETTTHLNVTTFGCDRPITWCSSYVLINWPEVQPWPLPASNFTFSPISAQCGSLPNYL